MSLIIPKATISVITSDLFPNGFWIIWVFLGQFLRAFLMIGSVVGLWGWGVLVGAFFFCQYF
jgi:hypothetical protein